MGLALLSLLLLDVTVSPTQLLAVPFVLESPAWRKEGKQSLLCRFQRAASVPGFLLCLVTSTPDKVEFCFFSLTLILAGEV